MGTLLSTIRVLAVCICFFALGEGGGHSRVAFHGYCIPCGIRYCIPGSALVPTVVSEVRKVMLDMIAF